LREIYEAKPRKCHVNFTQIRGYVIC